MRFVSKFETSGGDRVGEHKERPVPAYLFVESLDQEVVFSIEHGVQPGTTYISIGRAIDRVAKCHIVGRHCFSDSTGGATYLKKSPRHLLAGSDLRERAVFLGVEINLE